MRELEHRVLPLSVACVMLAQVNRQQRPQTPDSVPVTGRRWDCGLTELVSRGAGLLAKTGHSTYSSGPWSKAK